MWLWVQNDVNNENEDDFCNVSGQYVATKVSSESSFFAFPSMFFSQQHSTYIREVLFKCWLFVEGR